jgi:hypothetical protein
MVSTGLAVPMDRTIPSIAAQRSRDGLPRFGGLDSWSVRGWPWGCCRSGASALDEPIGGVDGAHSPRGLGLSDRILCESVGMPPSYQLLELASHLTCRRARAQLKGRVCVAESVHLLHPDPGSRHCAAPCLELVQPGVEPPERYRVLQLTEIPDRLVWSMVVT